MGFNVCTGWVGVLLLMVVPASAQSDDPFKGRTREEMDDEGRVIVTVPELWTKRPPSGTEILNLVAMSHARQGGHVMSIQREDGMNNEIENRERYLKYDSAKGLLGLESRKRAPLAVSWLEDLLDPKLEEAGDTLQTAVIHGSRNYRI